ncbi:MAG TPA: zinc metallopeptidase [Fimbriiglobus sp.]|nr:zinc metallopeptidase [Fimbriiglobus sp.]
MYYFDPLYFLFIGPAVLLSLWAQWRISSAYRRASRIPASRGLTGAQTAAAILCEANVAGVRIAGVAGELTDHYSPGEKVLRLSEGVYDGRSLAAQGIAAHEVGHAIQDDRRYPLLVVRNLIVPLAGFGGSVGMLIIIAGFALAFTGLIYVGIAVFSLTALFQIVNLPVEFDASRRAKEELLKAGIIRPEEEPEIARVLNAAALTYVAATLMSVLTVAYFLFRAGAFNRR